MESMVRVQLVPVGMRSSGLLPTPVHASKLVDTTEEEKEEKRKTQLAAP